MARKGAAEELIAFVIFGFLAMLAVEAVAKLPDLDPVGHQSEIALFMVGLTVFGTILGFVEVLS